MQDNQHVSKNNLLVILQDLRNWILSKFTTKEYINTLMANVITRNDLDAIDDRTRKTASDSVESYLDHLKLNVNVLQGIEQDDINGWDEAALLRHKHALSVQHDSTKLIGSESPKYGCYGKNPGELYSNDIFDRTLSLVVDRSHYHNWNGYGDLDVSDAISKRHVHTWSIEYEPSIKEAVDMRHRHNWEMYTDVDICDAIKKQHRHDWGIYTDVDVRDAVKKKHEHRWGNYNDDNVVDTIDAAHRHVWRSTKGDNKVYTDSDVVDTIEHYLNHKNNDHSEQELKKLIDDHANNSTIHFTLGDVQQMIQDAVQGVMTYVQNNTSNNVTIIPDEYVRRSAVTPGDIVYYVNNDYTRAKYTMPARAWEKILAKDCTDYNSMGQAGDGKVSSHIFHILNRCTPIGIVYHVDNGIMYYMSIKNREITQILQRSTNDFSINNMIFGISNDSEEEKNITDLLAPSKLPRLSTQKDQAQLIGLPVISNDSTQVNLAHSWPLPFTVGFVSDYLDSNYVPIRVDYGKANSELITEVDTAQNTTYCLPKKNTDVERLFNYNISQDIFNTSVGTNKPVCVRYFKESNDNSQISTNSRVEDCCAAQYNLLWSDTGRITTANITSSIYMLTIYRKFINNGNKDAGWNNNLYPPLFMPGFTGTADATSMFSNYTPYYETGYFTNYSSITNGIPSDAEQNQVSWYIPAVFDAARIRYNIEEIYDAYRCLCGEQNYFDTKIGTTFANNFDLFKGRDSLMTNWACIKTTDDKNYTVGVTANLYNGHLQIVGRTDSLKTITIQPVTCEKVKSIDSYFINNTEYSKYKYNGRDYSACMESEFPFKISTT